VAVAVHVPGLKCRADLPISPLITIYQRPILFTCASTSFIVFEEQEETYQRASRLTSPYWWNTSADGACKQRQSLTLPYPTHRSKTTKTKGSKMKYSKTTRPQRNLFHSQWFCARRHSHSPPSLTRQILSMSSLRNLLRIFLLLTMVFAIFSKRSPP
jgi:hypothetical protein